MMLEAGAFGHVQLAQNHGTGIGQPPDHRAS